MAGGIHATADIDRIEAPVTWKAYLMCAFASFGGIFFGYDSGYINGVNGSSDFIHLIMGPNATELSSSRQSLIVSILSAGTFFGAIIAGDVSERIGRKWTVILGTIIYMVGVIIQMITGVGGDALGVIVAGRLVAGLGVGFESAIVILYMSEIVCALLLPFKSHELTLHSAQRKSVVLSSPVTNFALPSVFFLLPALSTQPRTAPMPPHTAFLSVFNLHGLSFSAVACCSSQIPHVTMSSVESSNRPAYLFANFVASLPNLSTSRMSLPRLSPMRNTSAVSFLMVDSLLLG
jgi:MFS family permease